LTEHDQKLIGIACKLIEVELMMRDDDEDGTGTIGKE